MVGFDDLLTPRWCWFAGEVSGHPVIEGIGEVVGSLPGAPGMDCAHLGVPGLKNSSRSMLWRAVRGVDLSVSCYAQGGEAAAGGHAATQRVAG